MQRGKVETFWSLNKGLATIHHPTVAGEGCHQPETSYYTTMAAFRCWVFVRTLSGSGHVRNLNDRALSLRLKRHTCRTNQKAPDQRTQFLNSTDFMAQIAPEVKFCSQGVRLGFLVWA
ncbi:hypothetical protein GGR96_001702 [Thalassospira tepidiphila]|uniref:Uncharacterized protein n=2 Tax=Thalassospira tepidiphila TaxID=393657 RepID=A0A853KWA8_9PROT|nr:hypothetical protein [Thalassospira tepidiphila]OAZ08062.1 hypothetical protein TH4_18585 [Thalassospira tepidiphila MCCC 1A03514]